MSDRNATQVLIVGAGPVGLALAIELGLRGVECTIVERGDGVFAGASDEQRQRARHGVLSALGDC